VITYISIDYITILISEVILACSELCLQAIVKSISNVTNVEVFYFKFEFGFIYI
jgi:hypothetical protein